VFDKELNQYRQITQDEFKKNRDRYTGPNIGKVNVIDKKSGQRKQIPKDLFNKEIHLSLGDKKYLFLGKNKLTGKEKYINIYEWELLQNDYEIIDTKKFNQIKLLL
jgi:hypothetical protein